MVSLLCLKGSLGAVLSSNVRRQALHFCRQQLLVVGSSRKAFSVTQIDFSSARKFFEEYEHLGNCGLGVWHYGAVCDSKLIGVISFGTACFSAKRGVFSRIANEFGLKVYQISRGATIAGAPRNTASWVLSRALKLLQQGRGSCIVVAYADRVFNEMGTIYQACNGLYTGRTKPKDQANYVVKRRRMSGWLVRKKYGTRAMARLKRIDRHAIKIPLTSKYRYVFVQAPPLKKRLITRALRSIVLPYPKRRVERIPPMDIEFLVKKKVREAQ